MLSHTQIMLQSLQNNSYHNNTFFPKALLLGSLYRLYRHSARHSALATLRVVELYQDFRQISATGFLEFQVQSRR